MNKLIRGVGNITGNIFHIFEMDIIFTRLSLITSTMVISSSTYRRDAEKHNALEGDQ